jgi:hypothetical protein
MAASLLQDGAGVSTAQAFEIERWKRAAGIPCPDCPFLTKPRKETRSMNPDTGAIAQFETDEDAQDAGFTEPLNDKEARLLAGMNRHDRRAWLSKLRKTDRQAK